MILILCCRNAFARCKAQVLPLLVLCIPAFSSLPLSASVKTQLLSISVKEAPLERVFADITRQTGYDFWYEPDILKTSRKVTLELKNVSLETALQKCFEQQTLTYKIVDKTIVVTARPASAAPQKAPPVKGKVTDGKGTPLVGVSVRVKGTNTGTVTDKDGNYSIEADPSGVLVFSYIGYQTFEIEINGQTEVSLHLVDSNTKLDEVQVIGYGTTTRRYNTGNVSTVKGDVIAQQPVTNPLQALAGRVAGLQVTQANGLPGSAVNVQIRGRNSINANNNPLYIIDGVPFSSASPERISGQRGSASPLNSINPADIESIEILKDADATAIYGSRAANGVILITTKKGKAGKTSLSINANTGIATVTKMADMLNTSQYLQLRRDALANSNLTPNAGNAPDIVTWSPDVDNNWQNWYIGNTANITDASATLSGGNAQTSFLLSGTYHHETTVLPGHNHYKRANVHLNAGHISADKRFNVNASVFFTTDNSHISGSGFTLENVVTSVPNYPVYDANGKYNWMAGKTNYVAQSTAYMKGETDNLNGSVSLGYQIIRGLSIKGNFGYNKIQTRQIAAYPSTYYNPALQTQGNSTFADQYLQTYLFEPQLMYQQKTGPGNLEALAGATIQSNNMRGEGISANGYSSDLLLESLSYGKVTSQSSSITEYRYLSIFGRLKYELAGKYILNLNFRRDGSSRFGPGKQFGNFGSVGAAWIFSEEHFLQKAGGWLSYGKLRASYGTTGNDGIGDYAYLSLYGPNINYGNTVTITPIQLANDQFQWEVNKKAEAALELGLFENRLLFNTTWYHNTSGNQLIGFSLPTHTGFSIYQANLPAVVRNKGFEFELQSVNIKNGDLTWSSTLNLTIPKNELVRFPGLAASASFANTLVIGQPLNVIQRLHYQGIDPANGLPMVEDINKNGIYDYGISAYNNRGGDYVIAGVTDPEWYGGLLNTIIYKNFELNFLFQYTQQQGYNQQRFFGFGQLYNNWEMNLDYWRKPGDRPLMPKPFANFTETFTAFGASSAAISNASFLRLKNVSLSYLFPSILVKRWGMQLLKLYLQGQNVLTATRFRGYDPETANTSMTAIPPLKTFTAGIQCTF